MPRNPHIEAILIDRYGKSKRKTPKPLVQRAPRGLERSYLREIIRLLEPAKELVDQLIVSKGPELDAELAINDSIRIDEYPEDLERIFGDITLRYGQLVPGGTTKGIASSQASQLDLFNREQTARQFKSLLGIDVFSITPQLTTEISAFAVDNVKLIESIPQRYFQQVENTVLRNIRSGKRFADWKRELPNLYKKAKSSAALIARDQTNKFNGELNKARQTSLGIDDYTWRTSQDKRVRTKHKALDGLVFSWSDPKRQPPEGHPGFPIQCRCQAEPNIEATLEKLGM